MPDIRIHSIIDPDADSVPLHEIFFPAAGAIVQWRYLESPPFSPKDGKCMLEVVKHEEHGHAVPFECISKHESAEEVAHAPRRRSLYAKREHSAIASAVPTNA